MACIQSHERQSSESSHSYYFIIEVACIYNSKKFYYNFAPTVFSLVVSKSSAFSLSALFSLLLLMTHKVALSLFPSSTSIYASVLLPSASDCFLLFPLSFSSSSYFASRVLIIVDCFDVLWLLSTPRSHSPSAAPARHVGSVSLAWLLPLDGRCTITPLHSKRTHIVVVKNAAVTMSRHYRKCHVKWLVSLRPRYSLLRALWHAERIEGLTVERVSESGTKVDTMHTYSELN